MSNAPKTKKIIKRTEAQLKKIHAAHLRAARKERAEIKAANFGRAGGMGKPRTSFAREFVESLPDMASFTGPSSIIGVAGGDVKAGDMLEVNMNTGTFQKAGSANAISGEYARLPIPMLLWCPSCHTRHIDEGTHAMNEHKTHACQSCGMQWKPANVPTVGVQFLPGAKS